MPEGEKEEQEIENLFEKIIKENTPNLAKEIDIQVQEAQKIPNKLDPKRTTPRHTMIKMPKIMSWLVWLSGLNASLRTKGSPVRFPVRAHAGVVGQVPSRGPSD